MPAKAANLNRFLLLSNGGLSQALDEATVGPDGVPVQHFKKQMLCVGTYTHPLDGWTWEVTEEGLKKLVEDTNRLLSLGNPVEATVDHGQSARDTLGYVGGKLTIEDGVDADGNPTKWACGVHEIRGADNIKVAEANKCVSVEVDEFKDSAGNYFPEVILASSIVRKPVVRGQSGFVKIAASLDGKRAEAQVPILVLTKKKLSTQTGAQNMDLEALLTLLATNLGLTGLTTENALDMLKGYFTGRNGRYLSLNTSHATIEKDLADARAETATVKTKLAESEAATTAAKDEAKKLSLAAAAQDAPPAAVEIVATSTETVFESLQRDGHFSPAATQKLLGSAIGVKGARRKLSIAGDATSQTAFVQIALPDLIEAIRLNDPKKLGITTGTQGAPPAGTSVAAGQPGAVVVAERGDKASFEDQVTAATTTLQNQKKLAASQIGN